jgi:hypothetical protein
MLSIYLTMNKRSILLGTFLAGTVFSAWADAFDGTLYYTIFSGAPNVKRVDVSFDGSIFTVGTPVVIGTTVGADGITGNPQNPDLLLVGGQGGRINTISKSTGTATSYGSPASVFHLAVPTSTTVLGSGIPGSLARHTINPDGSLGLGTLIGITGDDTTITTIISTPSGFYYTDAGSGGFGNFGKITFNTGIDSATSGVTTRLNVAPVPSAHGGVYDPFSGDILLFGAGEISQYDLGTGTFVGSRGFSQGNDRADFDQGAVDGKGHLFVASNDGNLLMIDYESTHNATDVTDPSYYRFLDNNLDDIAPLIGSGGTSNVPEAGSTLAMLGMSFFGLCGLRRFARI